MAGRNQCSRARTRPLTHGPPQHTPPFETHDLAGILRATEAEVGAPRQVPDFGMLAWLLKPDRSYLSCAWIDILVCDLVQVSTDICDVNTFLGPKRLRTSWSSASPCMATKSRTSGTGERQVVIPTLIVSPSMFSPS